jgi:photosystem II stability/assembly factor-like uncharacterized protein
VRPPCRRALAAWVAALVLLAGCGKPARTAPAATASTSATASATAVAAVLGGRPASALHLDTVDFINAQIGWVAGHLGGSAAILRTLDGGATWEELPAGVGLFLALDFVDPDQGWAINLAGGEARIQHTADGGATWAVQWAGPADGMQSLAAAEDARVAMLDGHSGHAVLGGQLLATADGGASWHALAVPAGFTPTGMAWRDARYGMVAGTTCAGACHAAVLATADGGATWTALFTSADAVPPPAAGASLPGIALPTPDAGWLYFKTDALAGRLYATSDGGTTWWLEQADLAGGRTVAGPPAFADAGAGWLPVDNGAAPFAGGIQVTHDGGRTWTWVGGRRLWSILAVSLTSAADGWAVGRPAGSATATFLLHSADGGRTWRESALTLRPMRAVDFVSATAGFGAGAASDPRALLRSTDGGVTWTVRATLPGPVLALSFVDPNRGWAVDQPWPAGPQVLDVLATADGGATWRQVGEIARPSPPAPVALRFFDAQHGVLMTGAPPDWQVAATADGGQTWYPSGHVAISPGTSVLAAMPSADRLLLLLGPGSLVRSGDGGSTWIALPKLPAGLGEGEGLGASGPGDLWVVLQHGVDGATRRTLLRSEDGGATWRQVRLPDAMPLDGPLCVSAHSPSDAWLLSQEGLFATRDGGRSWVWAR